MFFFDAGLLQLMFADQGGAEPWLSALTGGRALVYICMRRPARKVGGVRRGRLNDSECFLTVSAEHNISVFGVERSGVYTLCMLHAFDL